MEFPGEFCMEHGLCTCGTFVLDFFLQVCYEDFTHTKGYTNFIIYAVQCTVSEIFVITANHDLSYLLDYFFYFSIPALIK